MERNYIGSYKKLANRQTDTHTHNQMPKRKIDLQSRKRSKNIIIIISNRSCFFRFPFVFVFMQEWQKKLPIESEFLSPDAISINRLASGGSSTK